MPYYQLQGDIFFIACSPQRMRKNREEVEACWQTLLNDIKTTPSAQLTDADVLMRSRRCCQRVEQWRRDCPMQTLHVMKRFCTDFQPIVNRALADRKAREAAAPTAPPPGGNGGPPQVPCTPTPEGKLLCQGPVPGLSCFPAAQGMFVCEVPALPVPTAPSPPSIPGPVYPDWIPDFGPGGPPRFPSTAFPSESFAARPGEPPPRPAPQQVLAKWLPWILLGGAAIGIYYLIRRMR